MENLLTAGFLVSLPDVLFERIFIVSVMIGDVPDATLHYRDTARFEDRYQRSTDFTENRILIVRVEKRNLYAVDLIDNTRKIKIIFNDQQF